MRSLGTGLSVVSLRSTRLLEKFAASFDIGESIVRAEGEKEEGVEGKVVGFKLPTPQFIEGWLKCQALSPTATGSKNS